MALSELSEAGGKPALAASLLRLRVYRNQAYGGLAEHDEIQARAMRSLRRLDQNRMLAHGFYPVQSNETEAAFAWANRAHRDFGNQEEALRIFRMLNARNPAFAGAWKERAFVYSKQGNDFLAATCYERSLALNPDHDMAANNLLALYLNAGVLDEAITVARNLMAQGKAKGIFTNAFPYAWQLAAPALVRALALAGDLKGLVLLKEAVDGPAKLGDEPARRFRYAWAGRNHPSVLALRQLHEAGSNVARTKALESQMPTGNGWATLRWLSRALLHQPDRFDYHIRSLQCHAEALELEACIAQVADMAYRFPKEFPEAFQSQRGVWFEALWNNPGFRRLLGSNACWIDPRRGILTNDAADSVPTPWSLEPIPGTQIDPVAILKRGQSLFIAAGHAGDADKNIAATRIWDGTNAWGFIGGRTTAFDPNLLLTDPPFADRRAWASRRMGMTQFHCRVPPRSRFVLRLCFVEPLPIHPETLAFSPTNRVFSVRANGKPLGDFRPVEAAGYLHPVVYVHRVASDESGLLTLDFEAKLGDVAINLIELRKE